MKRVKRILALLLAAAMLVLAAAAEQGGPSAAPDSEPAAEAAEEFFEPSMNEAAEAPAETPPTEDAAPEAQAPQIEAAPAERVASELGVSVEELASELGVSVEELLAMGEDELRELRDNASAGAGSAPAASGGDALADMGFIVDDGGTLVVYDGGEPDVAVPDGIRAIGPVAFCNHAGLRSVAIPASVTRIGSYAFADCAKLETVTLGDGLTSIEDHAFLNCASLRSIELPEGLASIGDEAFRGCVSLAGVAVPASAARIGANAFPEGALSMGAAQELESGDSSAAEEMAAQEEAWPVVLDEIELIDTDLLTIGVKEKIALREIGMPAFEGDGLTFESDKPDVVRVIDPEAGEIQGLKRGTATITATGADGQPRMCKVSVLAAPSKASFSPKSGALGVGQTMELEVKLPKNTASRTLSWDSSNEHIASVENGVVTALEEGQATITAKTFNGKTAKFTLTVRPAVVVIQVPSEEVMCIGGRMVYKELVLWPADAMADMSYESSDESVVAVDMENLEGGAYGLVAKGEGSAIITLTARNGDQVVTESYPVEVPPNPTGVKIDNPVEVLGVKEKYQLTATLEGDQRLIWDNVWESSNPKVLDVDMFSGALEPKRAGSATISVKTVNGGEGSVQDAITVQVKAAPKKIALNKKKETLGVGQELKLTASLSKNSSSKISWSSSNEDVAVVEDGLVRALSPGKTTITAKTFNRKKASCSVTVRAVPTGIDAGGAVALGVGQKYTLNVVLSPVSAGSKLTVENSNESAIKVDKAEVLAANTASLRLTARAEGSATIRLTTYNGQSASCNVTVSAAPTKIEIVNPVKNLGVNEVYQLRAQCNSDPVLLMHSKWKSSNRKVLQVDARTGRLTAKKVGKAKITVSMPKGTKTIKKSITIRVSKAPASVTLSPERATLGAGEKLQLKAALTKKSSSQIRWTSGDSAVATVDDSGLVTAVGGGETEIFATAFNGTRASCAVTVEGPRAPEVTVDGEAAQSGIMDVHGDVEFAWSSPESVEEYNLQIEEEGGATLVQRDGLPGADGSERVSSDDMKSGAVYRFLLEARINAGSETVSRTRVVRFRYVDLAADFEYEAGPDGGMTITGYRGTASTLTVPDTLEGKPVTRIATGAFNGGNSALLSSVAWPEGVIFEENSVAGLKGCADENGFLTIDGALCEYFGSAKSVTIPENVVRINDGAFDGNGSLTTVKIPDSVEIISARAFANCPKLKSMTGI